MSKHGYITAEEAEAAFAERLEFRSASFPMRAPHFVMYVRELLPYLVGESAASGGVSVVTSLNPDQPWSVTCGYSRAP